MKSSHTAKQGRVQPVDQFAAALAPDVRKAVLENSRAGHEKRTDVLGRELPAAPELRVLAGEIKQHTLEHLDRYLEQAEARLRENGAQVHWATDAEAARQAVLRILRENGATRLVKSKSMATEEIELNPFLEKEGVSCVETDLGEFIVQIDDDHPSHIVKPILHKNRRDIARSFERCGLGAYDDSPEVIARRARAFLRQKYLEADAGMTGANFVVAESGRIVLVTNEGNARFCLAAPRIHIAVVGIEKLVPRDRDLAIFLNLLARSATGQPITVYTEFVSGPRLEGRTEGPEQMHVIFLDNGRSDILASACREILRCIRCGACMNVCPVYRQASGHAYRSVYPGPLGAVLAPLLAGEGFKHMADLPSASSLCGACAEVCPVNIPISDLLLRLRDRQKRESGERPAWAVPWSWMATRPGVWKAALRAGRAVDFLPAGMMPAAEMRTWFQSHARQPWRGGAFRKWWRERSAHRDKTDTKEQRRSGDGE